MLNRKVASHPRNQCARRGAAAAPAACLVALLVTASASPPAQAQSPALAVAPAPPVVWVVADEDLVLWRAAFVRVARLADEGDAQAARLALRMRHAAAKAFGPALQTSPAQLRRWAQVVAHDDWANCDAPSAETLQLLPG